ncbi:MAG: ornithine carbamoyltransferase [Acidimicrobiales bacterium]|nr:ornithine carbamoyltransferase [Acidimicrobiales bacterium]
MANHILDIDDLTPDDFDKVIAYGLSPKSEKVMANKSAALLFEKPSARTRHATETAIVALGGHPITVKGDEVGIGKRESVHDLTLTLACYHAVIGARVFDHGVLAEMASAIDGAGAPCSVLNLLSDKAHPCQGVADIITIIQASKEMNLEISNAQVTYVGDSNNVASSLALACAMASVKLVVASPVDFQPEAELIKRVERLGGTIEVVTDPNEGVEGADFIYTDTWTSMGQEAEASVRKEVFRNYQVNELLISKAKKDVKIMHCLPAHRGEEITDAVLDSKSSIVFKQAYNRKLSAIGLLTLMVKKQGGQKWP